MALILNNNTITGSATNLADLAGIAGATTTVSGGRNYYSIGSLPLIYDDLVINPLIECLVLPTNSPYKALRPSAATSRLQIGSNRQKNGGRLTTSLPAIVVEKQPTTGGNTYHPDEASIYINRGALEWWEGTIVSNMAIALGRIRNNAAFELTAGSFIKEGAVFAAHRVTPPYTTNHVQINMDSVNLLIDGLQIQGSDTISPIYAPRSIPTTPPRIKLIGAGGISEHTNYSNAAGSFSTFRDYSSSSADKDINLFVGKKVRVYNSEDGSGTIIKEHNNSANHAHGLVELRKEFEVNFKDDAGNPLQNIATLVIDNDNGDRRNGFNEVYTNDLINPFGLSAADGSSGIIDVLTAVVCKTAQTFVGQDDVGQNKKDRRSKNDDTEDEFDVLFFGYNHKNTSTPKKLKGFGFLNFKQTLLIDNNISEQDEALTAALTTVTTLDEVHDALKLLIRNNRIREDFMLPNGTELGFATDWDITLNDQATDVVAVNTTTKLITIKATNIAEGVKFKTAKLQGTGVFGVTDTETISVGFVDANGDSYIDFISALATLDTWKVFASEADRDSNSNELGNGTGTSNYRFNFTATTYYLRVIRATTGSYIPIDVEVTVSGRQAISFDPTVVASETAIVVDNVLEVSKASRDFAHLAANNTTEA